VNNKKLYIILGSIAFVLIGVAIAVYFYIQKQIDKILAYTIDFKKASPKKISLDLIDFDLWLNINNPSSLTYDIISQEYKVYINNVYLTTIKNNIKYTIKGNATTPIGINVKFDPTQFIAKLGGAGLAAIISNPTKTTLTLDMKLKTKFFFYPVDIEYKYETNIKELTSGIENKLPSI